MPAKTIRTFGVAAAVSAVAALAPTTVSASPVDPDFGDPVPTQFLDCFGLPYSPVTAIYAQPGITTYGTTGDDVIFGTSGDDVIVALEGDDRVCAGAGVDQVFGDEYQTVLDTEGLVGGGNDKLDGEADSDALWGGGGADLIHGGSEGDIIWAGRDPDSVYAQKGNDAIDCGLGYDYVDGGRQTDSAGASCELQDRVP